MRSGNSTFIFHLSTKLMARSQLVRCTLYTSYEVPLAQMTWQSSAFCCRMLQSLDGRHEQRGRLDSLHPLVSLDGSHWQTRKKSFRPICRLIWALLLRSSSQVASFTTRDH